jgi:capsule polysaccharide export protein KpsE/RkpR
MARKSNKSPQELLKEYEDRANRARIRIVSEEAKKNPTIAKLQTALDSFNKEIAANSRKLAGPNSFDNRIKSAEMRLTWIHAEQEAVIAAEAQAQECRKYLQNQVNDLTLRMSKGEQIADETVSEILENMPTDPNVAELVAKAELLNNEWRDAAKAMKEGENSETATAGA